MRVEVNRKTKETDIQLALSLIELGEKDQSNKIEIESNGGPFIESIGLFSHFLNAFLFYAGLKVELKVVGDLWVDAHHTIEDIGICIGQAFRKLYLEVGSFERFSECLLPMDEALVRTALDISGRPFLYMGGFESNTLSNIEQSYLEFWNAFVRESRICLHVDVLRGTNRHHMFEGVYKSVGRCIKRALVTQTNIQSTKGVI